MAPNVASTAAATRRRTRASTTAGATGPRHLALILEDAGIAADPFSRVAARAIEELRGSEARIDAPATQLSAREAETLAGAGLDLAPRRRAEPDPMGETAARYAAILADSADVAEVAERLGV